MNVPRILLAGLVVLAVHGCSQEEPAEVKKGARGTPAAQTKVPPALPVPPEAARKAPRSIGVTLSVNDARKTKLTAGLPIYVQCSIANEHRSAAVTGEALAALHPTIVTADSKAVAATWTLLRPPPTRIEARAMVVCAWTLTTALPEGSYRIAVALDATALTSDPPIGRVAVSAARVQIVKGTVDPGWQAHFERRMLALRGDHNALIALLGKQVDSDPDDSPLRVELADALAASGRHAEAADQLRRVAAVLRKQRRGRGEHPVPDWLVFRLEALDARAAQSKDPAK